MQRGYVLVKEQMFFRKELVERLPWLIRIRWVAVVSAFSGCGIMYFSRQHLPLPLMIIPAGVFCYNLLFLLVWKKLTPFDPATAFSDTDSPVICAEDMLQFSIFAHTQISLDLFSLCLAIWYSGGIDSPLALLVVFPVILTGILMSPASCYFYGLAILLAMGGITWLQTSILPHGDRSGEIMIRCLSLLATVLIAFFLVITLKLSLRIKGRQLLKLSKDLDASNTKLTAIYEMVKEMGMCAESKVLMDTATRWAAGIMGVKACSIKLLDAQQKRLRFTSTYGFSENYTRSKESIDIQMSPINRKIIDGAPYAMGHTTEEDKFAYPEDIRKEGIASMICLPLKVEKRMLGVFSVYSDVDAPFTERDVQFFALMADLTALEIEKLNMQLSRTWFLQKAAHQLRSPLHAVVSMIRILLKVYLGSMILKQEDIVRRCEKRLELMDSLVSDLLNLSIRRTPLKPDALYPVQASTVLQSLSGMFASQAQERNIEIVFRIDDNLPAVTATERLLDDLFTNLISNALKYTPPGGKVTVCLIRSEDGGLLIEVTDTGIGIPEHDFSRLFSEFYRAENARDFSENGTGLGLVIVKEILDKLKGTIFVSSRIREGSTFICNLAVP